MLPRHEDDFRYCCRFLKNDDDNGEMMMIWWYDDDDDDDADDDDDNDDDHHHHHHHHRHHRHHNHMIMMMHTTDSSWKCLLIIYYFHTENYTRVYPCLVHNLPITLRSVCFWHRRSFITSGYFLGIMILGAPIAIMTFTQQTPKKEGLGALRFYLAVTNTDLLESGHLPMRPVTISCSKSNKTYCSKPQP